MSTKEADLGEVAVKIRAKAKCSMDEAWSGLASAYVYLDRRRTVAEQYWFLIHVGKKFVMREIAQKYTPLGVYSTVDLESAYGVSSPDDEDFILARFDDGPVREYARAVIDGKVTTVSLDSVRAFVRKHHKEISTYGNCKKVLARFRVCAGRL